MRGKRLEMMHDHVRAIHRAVTGGDPPQREPAGEAETMPTADEVARRFAELEALTRSLHSIAERVPSYSFAPPLDVIGMEREVIFELGVPGVELADVDVEIEGETLIVSGARSTNQALDGRVYFHAEMPRGPFRRVVGLPEPISGSPRVEVENGVIRVRLTKTSKSTRPRA